jgi:hypothetical protein
VEDSCGTTGYANALCYQAAVYTYRWWDAVACCFYVAPNKVRRLLLALKGGLLLIGQLLLLQANASEREPW